MNSMTLKFILTATLMDLWKENMTTLACFLGDEFYCFCSDNALILASSLRT